MEMWRSFEQEDAEAQKKLGKEKLKDELAKAKSLEDLVKIMEKIIEGGI